MRISDWSSDVCSSDLLDGLLHVLGVSPGDLGPYLSGVRIGRLEPSAGLGVYKAAIDVVMISLHLIRLDCHAGLKLDAVSCKGACARQFTRSRCSTTLPFSMSSSVRVAPNGSRGSSE